MDRKEKLVLEIMQEAEKDGEPVTRAEAEEMAEMELKANASRHYEQSAKPRKQSTREVKKDAEKVEIIKKIYDFLLTSGEESATIVNEQKEIKFREFSITLTKHRPKKEG
jgi:tRNA nucleotidyltransferase/poly(A) polymerase